MNYIILDLEWNQPTSYHTPIFKEIGDRLMFEMIQIGAVRMNDALEIEDSVSIPIQPTHYVKIHPRIARMTGLDNDVLADAPVFDEAIRQFADWCGEDYCLITWGCDDVSVLQQNLDFFESDVKLAKMYDLQRMFSDRLKLGKDRKGLKAAMEMMEIDPEEEKNFHNALNDAYYTALVFRKLGNPEEILNFGQQPRRLVHMESNRRRSTPVAEVESVAQGLASEAAQKQKCPQCGQMCKIEPDGYVMQSPGRYVAIGKCRVHGQLFLRAQFIRITSEQIGMALSASMAKQQHVAYVHTKHLQRKLQGITSDENVSCRGGNMPFDDDEV